MISAEKIISCVLRLVMGIVLVFMLAGFALMALEAGDSGAIGPVVASVPLSAVFFKIAVGAVLFTPMFLSVVITVVFLRDGQILMALSSFLLFIVLIFSVWFQMAGLSPV